MPCSAALGVPVDRPLVAFVGTLEPRKGVVPLVAAFDQVARAHPDAVLVLGGQTGWGMAETERALAAARHPERIVRTGYLPDEAVPALLRQAAVVAYPALEEGFGLPALEALACGAPLVTTEGTAMAEMAGGAALLVPPGDVAGLAAALDGPSRKAGPPPAGRSGSPWRRSGPGRPASRCTCGPMRSPWRPRSRVPRMRALITGGKGFVGQWLAAHLKDHGDDVAVIDIETDVADGAAVRRVMADVAPEAVYHLAAMTHVGESWENPSQVLRVNVLGTAEILAAARSLEGSPRVLVVSSAEVYGVVDPGAAAAGRGHARPQPASPYAASKLAAEAVALQAWRGFGQPVVVVRPFNHIGPGQSPNFFVPALAKRIVEARRSGARSLPVGTLTTRRDFTDVRDVVVAYRLLIERGVPGEVYNVCSGRDVAMSEVAGQLLDLAGADLTLETDPDLVRPVDVPVLRGSAERLQAATGLAARIPLATTLADVLTSWEAD